MSPNVGNFVHDLVEMAKAMEELPKVERELADADRKVEELQITVQDRELHIIELKSENEALHSRIRSLEVERDDASFRVLEAEDKAHNILAMAKAARVSLDQMTGLLDPPKPQPEPIVEVKLQDDPMGENNPISPYYNPQTADIGPGSSEGPPTQTSTSPSGSLQDTHGGNEPDWKQDQAETSTLPPKLQPAASQGPSEGNPIQVDGSTAPSGEVEPKPSGPYANKLYYDHPAYVPLRDWVDGGGTKENYNWRPLTAPVV